MAFKKTNSGTLKGDISKALSVTTKKISRKNLLTKHF